MGTGAELESQNSDRGEQGKQAGQSPRTPASGGRPSTRQWCPALQSRASQEGDRSSVPRGAGHERAGPKAVQGPVAATFSKAPSPQQGCLHGHHPDLPSPCSPLWDPLWRPDLCEAQPLRRCHSWAEEPNPCLPTSRLILCPSPEHPAPLSSLLSEQPGRPRGAGRALTSNLLEVTGKNCFPPNAPTKQLKFSHKSHLNVHVLSR